MFQDNIEAYEEDSDNTKDLQELVQKIILIIQEAHNDEKEEDRQKIAKNKLKFLKLLKIRLNAQYCKKIVVNVYEDLLSRYTKELRRPIISILETSLIRYHVFQEHHLFKFETKNLFQGIFQGFKLDQIEFLKAVLRSEILHQYYKNFNSAYLKFQNWLQIQENCVTYFEKCHVLRIRFSHNSLHPIIGFTLNRGQFVISDIYSKFSKMETLILVHLYFQRFCHPEEILYQCFYQENILDFESEILPIRFNNLFLTKERIGFLQNWENWKLDSQDFRKQLGNQGPILKDNLVSPVNFIMKHNLFLNKTIYQIQQCLVDLANKDVFQLRRKYRSQRDQILKNNQVLSSQYTNLEYYQVLKEFIIISFYNQDRLKQLRNYHTQHDQMLKVIFDFMLSSTNFCSISLIQQLFLWTFQYKFNAKVIQCGKMCCQIILRNADQVVLPIDIQNYLQIIVNSQGVREVVMRINQIEGRISHEDDLIQEYQDLHRFFQLTPIITFKISGLYGISLINGRIGINFKTLHSNKIQDRAMVFIILVHEAYCHKKRKDYVSPGNVLQLTPQKMNATENLDPKLQSGESGYFFEDEIFGKVLHKLSPEQAQYILTGANWLKPKEQFKTEFQALPEHQKQQKNQQQQQGVQQKNAMAESSESEDEIRMCVRLC